MSGPENPHLRLMPNLLLSGTAAHPDKEECDPRAGEGPCTTTMKKSWTRQPVHA